MSWKDSSPAWIGAAAKEPLVHFLIGGLLIYTLFAWRGEPVDPSSRSITVSREDQAQLSLAFERTMGRSPTDAELDRQVQRFVREEVLYREALRLGLDGNDGVVRRRMAQKMDLIAAAQAEAAQPSDEALEAWYNAYPERFGDQARYTLDQAFKAETLEAKGLVDALNAQQNGDDFAILSDPISLPKSVSGMSRKEVLDRFGEQFLAGIDGLEPSNNWQGPIRSGFGFHAVRLRSREADSLVPFSKLTDSARDKVENDWRNNTIADRKARGFAILRDAYTIEIAE